MFIFYTKKEGFPSSKASEKKMPQAQKTLFMSIRVSVHKGQIPTLVEARGKVYACTDIFFSLNQNFCFNFTVFFTKSKEEKKDRFALIMVRLIHELR